MTAGGDDGGSAALEAIEQQVARTPLERTSAALEEVARRWPRTAAGERARLWHGDLELQKKRYDSGIADYARLAAQTSDARMRSLSHRGLANVALERHAWSDAIRELDAAHSGADLLVRFELVEKRGVALVERRRDRLELGAWLVIALYVALSARRVVRASTRQFPTAAKFLVPTYAALLAGAARLGRNPWRAMLLIALGSVVMTSLAFAAPLPKTAAARGMLLATLSVATLALFYVACRRAGILDPLIETLRGGAEAG